MSTPCISALSLVMNGCIFLNVLIAMTSYIIGLLLLKKNKIEVVGYVIMPNHLHSILYFPEPGFNLDKILSNGKRFMAYELVNRLEKANDTNTLTILENAVTEREKKKNNNKNSSHHLMENL